MFCIVIGSILFFPALSAYADLGAWVFLGGSLLYLLVTVHDLAEVIKHLRQVKQARTIWHSLEFLAAASASYWLESHTRGKSGSDVRGGSDRLFVGR